MRQSERDKRNYLIIGLCAVLVVMVVGFAAFSSQLQINGTSNISSNWDVQITDITRFASSGSGVSDVSGSPSYDNSNGLTATFNTNLTSPGDYATYKIKVENLGSLNAVLSNITLTSGSSNDITYYVNKDHNNSSITDTDRLIDEDDVLNPNGDTNNLDEGYVYVTVKYNNYEGQTSPTGDNKTVSATVKLDFVQSNSEATVTPPAPATTFVYAYHTDQRTIGSSTVTDGVSDYTTLSSYQNGKKWFLKYEINGSNEIQNAWACMKYDFINEPVCLQGGNASYYTANRGIIEGLQSTFTSNGGSCSAGDSISDCNVGALNLYAFPNGDAFAGDYSEDQGCNVGSNGFADCNG